MLYSNQCFRLLQLIYKGTKIYTETIFFLLSSPTKYLFSIFYTNKRLTNIHSLCPELTLTFYWTLNCSNCKSWTAGRDSGSNRFQSIINTADTPRDFKCKVEVRRMLLAIKIKAVKVAHHFLSLQQGPLLPSQTIDNNLILGIGHLFLSWKFQMGCGPPAVLDYACTQVCHIAVQP